MYVKKKHSSFLISVRTLTLTTAQQSTTIQWQYCKKTSHGSCLTFLTAVPDNVNEKKVIVT